jgi:hypothetical protein
MEFTKGQVKKIALRNFFILYIFSIALITLVIYFLFNTPASLFKKSIEKYKNAETEEGNLLRKTDAITRNINKIIQADNDYKVSTNVADREKFKETFGEYTNEFTNAIQDLENDSAGRTTSFSKRNAINYLFMFRNFLEYSEANSSDFASQESRLDPRAVRVVVDSFNACKLQRELIKIQLAQVATKNVATVAQVNNTEAANKAANERLIDELQSKLRQAQTDLNNCNEQKKNISQAATQAATVNTSEQQKASLLIDAGKKIYTQALQGKNFKGGTIEQRAYFGCAKQIFEEAKAHFASSDIDDYLKNIDVQLKKLSY